MNLYKYPRSTCHVSVGIDTQYISRNPLVSKITFFCLTKISVPSNVTIISAIDRELLCHEMRTSRYTWKRWIGLLSGTSIWINREQHTYSGFHMFTLRLRKHGCPQTPGDSFHSPFDITCLLLDNFFTFHGIQRESFSSFHLSQMLSQKFLYTRLSACILGLFKYLVKIVF